MTSIKQFIRDESGAVTIDWVALTAGILLLGIALVFGIFNEGVDPLANRIGTALSDAAIDIDTGDAPTLNPGAGG
ncbi:MAG: hypothetical protein AAF415_05955 [Pseudomonadota bacterium]